MQESQANAAVSNIQDGSTINLNLEGLTTTTQVVVQPTLTTTTKDSSPTTKKKEETKDKVGTSKFNQCLQI